MTSVPGSGVHVLKMSVLVTLSRRAIRSHDRARTQREEPKRSKLVFVGNSQIRQTDWRALVSGPIAVIVRWTAALAIVELCHRCRDNRCSELVSLVK